MSPNSFELGILMLGHLEMELVEAAGVAPTEIRGPNSCTRIETTGLLRSNVVSPLQQELHGDQVSHRKSEGEFFPQIFD